MSSESAAATVPTTEPPGRTAAAIPDSNVPSESKAEHDAPAPSSTALPSGKHPPAPRKHTLEALYARFNRAVAAVAAGEVPLLEDVDAARTLVAMVYSSPEPHPNGSVVSASAATDGDSTMPLLMFPEGLFRTNGSKASSLTLRAQHRVVFEEIRGALRSRGHTAVLAGALFAALLDDQPSHDVTTPAAGFGQLQLLAHVCAAPPRKPVTTMFDDSHARIATLTGLVFRRSQVAVRASDGSLTAVALPVYSPPSPSVPCFLPGGDMQHAPRGHAYAYLEWSAGARYGALPGVALGRAAAACASFALPPLPSAHDRDIASLVDVPMPVFTPSPPGGVVYALSVPHFPALMTQHVSFRVAATVWMQPSSTLSLPPQVVIATPHFGIGLDAYARPIAWLRAPGSAPLTIDKAAQKLVTELPNWWDAAESTDELVVAASEEPLAPSCAVQLAIIVDASCGLLHLTVNGMTAAVVPVGRSIIRPAQGKPAPAVNAPVQFQYGGEASPFVIGADLQWALTAHARESLPSLATAADILTAARADAVKDGTIAHGNIPHVLLRAPELGPYTLRPQHAFQGFIRDVRASIAHVDDAGTCRDAYLLAHWPCAGEEALTVDASGNGRHAMVRAAALDAGSAGAKQAAACFPEWSSVAPADFYAPAAPQPSLRGFAPHALLLPLAPPTLASPGDVAHSARSPPASHAMLLTGNAHVAGDARTAAADGNVGQATLRDAVACLAGFDTVVQVRLPTVRASQLRLLLHGVASATDLGPQDCFSSASASEGDWVASTLSTAGAKHTPPAVEQGAVLPDDIFSNAVAAALATSAHRNERLLMAGVAPTPVAQPPTCVRAPFVPTMFDAHAVGLQSSSHRTVAVAVTVTPAASGTSVSAAASLLVSHAPDVNTASKPEGRRSQPIAALPPVDEHGDITVSKEEDSKLSETAVIVVDAGGVASVEAAVPGGVDATAETAVDTETAALHTPLGHQLGSSGDVPGIACRASGRDGVLTELRVQCVCDDGDAAQHELRVWLSGVLLACFACNLQRCLQLSDVHGGAMLSFAVASDAATSRSALVVAPSSIAADELRRTETIGGAALLSWLFLAAEAARTGGQHDLDADGVPKLHADSAPCLVCHQLPGVAGSGSACASSSGKESTTNKANKKANAAAASSAPSGIDLDDMPPLTALFDDDDDDPKPAAAAGGGPVICTSCTYANTDVNRTRCEVCDTVLPVAAATPPTRNGPPNEPWFCNHCMLVLDADTSCPEHPSLNYAKDSLLLSAMDAATRSTYFDEYPGLKDKYEAAQAAKRSQGAYSDAMQYTENPLFTAKGAGSTGQANVAAAGRGAHSRVGDVLPAAPAPAPAPTPAPAPAPAAAAGWACPMCTYVNTAASRKCEMCEHVPVKIGGAFGRGGGRHGFQSRPSALANAKKFSQLQPRNLNMKLKDVRFRGKPFQASTSAHGNSAWFVGLDNSKKPTGPAGPKNGPGRPQREARGKLSVQEEKARDALIGVMDECSAVQSVTWAGACVDERCVHPAEARGRWQLGSGMTLYVASGNSAGSCIGYVLAGEYGYDRALAIPKHATAQCGLLATASGDADGKVNPHTVPQVDGDGDRGSVLLLACPPCHAPVAPTPAEAVLVHPALPADPSSIMDAPQRDLHLRWRAAGVFEPHKYAFAQRETTVTAAATTSLLVPLAAVTQSQPLVLSLSDDGESLSVAFTDGASRTTWDAHRIAERDRVRVAPVDAPAPAIDADVELDVLAAARLHEPCAVQTFSRPLEAFSGLENMRAGLVNVCYQNALLQSLFMTEGLRHALLTRALATVVAPGTLPQGVSVEDVYSFGDAGSACLAPAWLAGACFGDAGVHDGLGTLIEESPFALSPWRSGKKSPATPPLLQATPSATAASLMQHAVMNRIQWLFARMSFSQRPVMASHALQRALPSQFSAGKQQDVGEFYLQLMDALHMQANADAPPAANSSAASTVHPSSIIQELFEGSIVQARVCENAGTASTAFATAPNELRCGQVSYRSDTFLSYTARIPSERTAIVDVCAIVAPRALGRALKLQIPEGFELLPVDLNRDRGGTAPYTYLAVRHARVGSAAAAGDDEPAPIIELKVSTYLRATTGGSVGLDALAEHGSVNPDFIDPVPAPALPGWVTLSCDLNAGGTRQGDRVYLSFRRGRNASPVCDVRILSREAVPEGFVKLVENLSNGGGDTPLHIAYRTEKLVRGLRVHYESLLPSDFSVCGADVEAHEALIVAGRAPKQWRSAFIFPPPMRLIQQQHGEQAPVTQLLAIPAYAAPSEVTDDSLETEAAPLDGSVSTDVSPTTSGTATPLAPSAAVPAARPATKRSNPIRSVWRALGGGSGSSSSSTAATPAAASTASTDASVPPPVSAAAPTVAANVARARAAVEAAVAQGYQLVSNIDKPIMGHHLLAKHGDGFPFVQVAVHRGGLSLPATHSGLEVLTLQPPTLAPAALLPAAGVWTSHASVHDYTHSRLAMTAAQDTDVLIVSGRLGPAATRMRNFFAGLAIRVNEAGREASAWGGDWIVTGSWYRPGLRRTCPVHMRITVPAASVPDAAVSARGAFYETDAADGSFNATLQHRGHRRRGRIIDIALCYADEFAALPAGWEVLHTSLPKTGGFDTIVAPPAPPPPRAGDAPQVYIPTVDAILPWVSVHGGNLRVAAPPEPPVVPAGGATDPAVATSAAATAPVAAATNSALYVCVRRERRMYTGTVAHLDEALGLPAPVAGLPLPVLDIAVVSRREADAGKAWSDIAPGYEVITASIQGAPAVLGAHDVTTGVGQYLAFKRASSSDAALAAVHEIDVLWSDKEPMLDGFTRIDKCIGVSGAGDAVKLNGAGSGTRAVLLAVKKATLEPAPVPGCPLTGLYTCSAGQNDMIREGFEMVAHARVRGTVLTGALSATAEKLEGMTAAAAAAMQTAPMISSHVATDTVNVEAVSATSPPAPPASSTTPAPPIVTTRAEASTFTLERAPVVIANASGLEPLAGTFVGVAVPAAAAGALKDMLAVSGALARDKTTAPLAASAWLCLGVWRRLMPANPQLLSDAQTMELLRTFHPHFELSFDTAGTTAVGLYGADAGTSYPWQLGAEHVLRIAVRRDTSARWEGGRLTSSTRVSSCDLQEIVDSSHGQHLLAIDNQIQCDVCGCRTDHRVMSHVARAPRYMSVMLARMYFNTAENKAMKMLDSVRLQPLLTLPAPPTHVMEHLAAASPRPAGVAAHAVRSGGIRYALYAVIVHVGETANSGHYYCFARRSDAPAAALLQADAPQCPWMRFNDSSVQVSSWADMQSSIGGSLSDTAYILLYRRLDDDGTDVASTAASAAAQNGVDAALATAAASDMVPAPWIRRVLWDNYQLIVRQCAGSHSAWAAQLIDAVRDTASDETAASTSAEPALASSGHDAAVPATVQVTAAAAVESGAASAGGVPATDHPPAKDGAL